MPTTPSPLRYEITHCSSWDNEHCPELLLVEEDEGNVPDDSHSPKHKGWQTEKYSPDNAKQNIEDSTDMDREPVCPQDLIIHMSPGPAHIHELQLLSHHYKIATKVDIYIGVVKDPSCMMDNEPMDAPSSPTSDTDSERDDKVVEFTRLGYIMFDDNTKNGFRARELKTVPINSNGEFIRLVFRNCHRNKLNVHHQIGIEALNILGVPLSYEAEINKVMYTTQQHDDSSILSGSTWRSSISSSYSLNGYLTSPGAEIQSCVTALKALEQEADRELRQMFKSIRKKLEALMAEVKVLEKAKIDAVKHSNFDKASEIKPEIDAIMNKAHEIIQQSGIQEYLHEGTQEEASHQDSFQQHSTLKDSMFDEAIENWTMFDATSAVQADSVDSASPVTPLCRTAESPRIVPSPRFAAYQRSPKIEPTLSESVMNKIRANSTASYDSMPSSPDDKERYYNAVSFFKKHNVDAVRSLDETSRKTALEKIKKRVVGAYNRAKAGGKNKKSDLLAFFNLGNKKMDYSETVSAFAQATLYIIREAMLDSRTGIIETGYSIWRTLNKFCDIEEKALEISMVFDALERAFEALLLKTNHDKENIRTAGTDLVLTLSYVYATPPYSVIPLYAGRPRKVLHHQNEIKSRIELVEMAIEELGLCEDRLCRDNSQNSEPGSIELDDLAAFVATYADYATNEARNPEVHEALMRLLVYASDKVGYEIVKKYFDQDMLLALAERHTAVTRTTKKTALQKREPSRSQAPAGDAKKITIKRTTTVKRQEPASLRGGKSTTAPSKKSTATRSKTETSAARTKVVSKSTAKVAGDKSKQLTENNTCIFCNKTSTEFNDNTLIKHYYRDCPRLTVCTECNELVENVDLKDHKENVCNKGRKTTETTKKKPVSSR